MIERVVHKAESEEKGFQKTLLGLNPFAAFFQENFPAIGRLVGIRDSANLHTLCLAISHTT